MLEKANRLQDPKKRTTPTGRLVLFLIRVSFYAFKTDFRYLAVRKSIISGAYWLELVIMELTMLKDVGKNQTVYRILKKGLPLLVVIF